MKSFAGTTKDNGEPITQWICNHLLQSSSNNNWYTQEQHTKLCIFLLGIEAYDMFQRRKPTKALIISKRNEKTGEILSAALIQEYNQKVESSLKRKLVKNYHDLKAFTMLAIKDGIPDLIRKNSQHKKEAKQVETKLEATRKAIHKWHTSKNGPKEDHWYINIVGVNNKYKHMGYGKELLQKINTLADQVGQVCYLECGQSNVEFYKKMGYQDIIFKTN